MTPTEWIWLAAGVLLGLEVLRQTGMRIRQRWRRRRDEESE